MYFVHTLAISSFARDYILIQRLYMPSCKSARVENNDNTLNQFHGGHYCWYGRGVVVTVEEAGLRGFKGNGVFPMNSLTAEQSCCTSD